MRYDNDGNIIKDFILNKKPFDVSKILIAGNNFGCGSSREHAPWALFRLWNYMRDKFKFMPISFYNNCFKNGILPIILSEEKNKKNYQSTQKDKKK